MRYLFFLSLYSCCAFAGFGLTQPECPTKSLYEKVNFYPPEMAGSFSTIAKLQPALDASFSYSNGTTSDGTPYSCSGTYTSNAGHFSSALHCVRKCLLETGHFSQTGRTKLVRTAKPFPATCAVNTRNGSMQMNIWAAGDCYADHKMDCSGEHDFVFGQVVGMRTACEKIRARPVQQGEKIVAIGTTSGKTKGRETNPDGIRPYFSLGEVLDPYSTGCDEVFILPNGNKEIRRKPNRRREGGMGGGHIVEGERTRLEGLERVSADASFAASGGSVIDANGEAIGIITNGTDNEERECIGQTHFNPIAPILKKMQTQLSSRQMQELTNCK